MDKYIDDKIKSLKEELKYLTISNNPNQKMLENVFGEVKINVSEQVIRSTEITSKLMFYKDIKLFRKLNSEAELIDIISLMRFSALFFTTLLILRFTNNYHKIEYAKNFVHDIYSDSYMNEIRIFEKEVKKDIKKEEKKDSIQESLFNQSA